MNVGRAGHQPGTMLAWSRLVGVSPIFQGKMNELPDIYNLRINSR
jgi:hypothetical protein